MKVKYLFKKYDRWTLIFIIGPGKLKNTTSKASIPILYQTVENIFKFNAFENLVNHLIININNFIFMPAL